MRLARSWSVISTPDGCGCKRFTCVKGCSLIEMAQIYGMAPMTTARPGHAAVHDLRRRHAASLLVRFLWRWTEGAEGKVLLILDSLRVHHACKVAPWAARHLDAIEPFHLPSYAPALNPDEYLNNALKGRVHHHGLPYTRQEGLKHAVLSALCSIQGRTDYVRNVTWNSLYQHIVTNLFIPHVIIANATRHKRRFVVSKPL